MNKYILNELDIEAKKWDPSGHPRDKNGQFIRNGGAVRLSGRNIGNVVGTRSRGRIEVTDDEGKTRVVRADQVEVVKGDKNRQRSGVRLRPESARELRDQTGLDSIDYDPDYQAEVDKRDREISDREYAQHTAKIEKTISAALQRGEATDKVHTLDEDGRVWTAERAKMHKQIVDELYLKAKEVPSEGKTIIAGGLGGAGKSTVLKKSMKIEDSDYFTINPDDVKEAMADHNMIPVLPGLSPMETSPMVHEESSHIANLLAQRAYSEKKNVIWDITMSSRGSVEKRIGEMREKGYGQVEAVFVDIPVEVSVERALARHRRGMEDYDINGKGFGGRYVPPSLIRKNSSSVASSANRKVFDDLRDQFDNWQLFDNSGSAPQKVSAGGKVSEIKWSEHPGGYTTDLSSALMQRSQIKVKIIDFGENGSTPDFVWYTNDIN